jgi:hypothetical protein
VEANARAWLRGAKVTKTLAELKAVTAGALSIEIDGSTADLTGVSLAAATSYSDVADILTTALDDEAEGATVEYSSLFKAFTVKSPADGESSSVGWASGTLAEALGLDEASGGTRSPGGVGGSIADTFDRVQAETQNWITFTTAWETTDAFKGYLAKWASENYGYLYVAWTTAASVLNQTSETDPASLLVAGGWDHTCIIYGHLRHAAFVQGIAGAVPWERVNGALTFAFKRQAGLEALVSRKADADALEAKRCNYLGNFATRNAEFRFLYPGALTASDYGFIDSYVNSIWLNSAIQLNCLEGLAMAGRVPYTERGFTMIRAWIFGAIQRGLVNGVVERGISLSDNQKEELTAEAGRDISAEIQNQGYFTQVLDPGALVRAQRGTPIVNVWYAYAGSVQRIEIASTAVL